MPRPWYTYVLLFLGSVALLAAAFGPMVGATSTPPGGTVLPDGRLRVLPGSPLARAGAATGDRWTRSETIQPGPPDERGDRPLRWRNGIPRSGNIELARGGRPAWLDVRPAPPRWPVRLAWMLLGLLNTGLVALALALFWQRPRDGRAQLLGLVLLLAPVFAFPREPRLFALVLAAHFFSLFPAPPRRRSGWRTAALYLPFVLLGAVGSSLIDRGQIRQGAGLYDLLALGYASYSLALVLWRLRGAAPEARPVQRTLAICAGAELAAVLAGVSQRLWVIADQYVPANLLPALLFGGGVAHLVFRLRALEVQVVARRTLQYLLARWTLGTLFLIPGLIFVFRLGQLAGAHEQGRPGDVLGLLVWMFLLALLLAKRQSVLRNLDRRFFRDHDAARQRLLALSGELGGQADPEAVLAVLERGVTEALRPRFLRFALPHGPEPDRTVLSLPLARGDTVAGWLHLGPKENGLPYSGEERQLLEATAVQAAMALENARLGAALLARQRDELASRTSDVLAGAEEERRRLAADLHDLVLPELRQIAGEVDRLKGRANGLAPELGRLEADVRGTMDSVREVMEALRPSTLDMLGLPDALESYLRRGGARLEPPLTVSVRRSGEEPALDPEQSLAVYRICQEAINNLLKHSSARRAGIEVECRDGELAVAIWDDGRGFDVEAARGRGRGLDNIRYRADLAGASVSWSARDEGGTRFEVRLWTSPIFSSP